jgi:glycosyltransferase involved in cell wall biosynthesis
LKLLVYSHFFAPSIGGVESAVLSLARGLAELRVPGGEKEFDVTLVTQTPAGNFDDRALLFRVVRQPGLRELWRLIRASDVVHLAGPALLPNIFGFLARKPMVVEHHGYQAICLNGLLVHQPDRSVCPGHFQARRYQKCLRCYAQETSWQRSFASLLLMWPRYLLVRQVAANLAISQHVLERHALPRSSVVYYGIDDPLENQLDRDPADTLCGRMCFAYVGRFCWEKGVPVFLEAVRLLREKGYEFDIRLIGDGPLRPELEAIIARNRLETCVRITGFLTGPALAEALEPVRAVVMPSVCEETAGLAAIEQMLRGRLVIASKIGGLAEVVGEAGLTCLPGDAEALAGVMKKVLQQPDLVVSLGRKARDRALRFFARRRMIEEHARIYSHVFSNKSKED